MKANSILILIVGLLWIAGMVLVGLDGALRHREHLKQMGQLDQAIAEVGTIREEARRIRESTLKLIEEHNKSPQGTNAHIVLQTHYWTNSPTNDH